MAPKSSRNRVVARPLACVALSKTSPVTTMRSTPPVALSNVAQGADEAVEDRLLLLRVREQM